MEVAFGSVSVILNRYESAEILSRLPLFFDRVSGYDREHFEEEWRELWTGDRYGNESIPSVATDDIDVTVMNY